MQTANISAIRPYTRGKGSLLCVAALMTVATLATIGCGTMSNQTTPTQQAKTIDKALWVANGANVVEFLPTQLMSGTSDQAPHRSINSTVFGAPQGVTFDAFGNLWVIDGGTVSTGGTVKPALERFSASQLAALGTNSAPAPSVLLHSNVFTFPQQAVFDSFGNLWVSDNGSNAIYVFTPLQLAAGSADAVPVVTITSTPALQGPLGITFDAKGDLWIANNASTTIYEFAASELPANSGSFDLTPSVILSDDGKGSIQGPWALIFDSKGDLYSSNANAPDTIVVFAPSSLTASGSPVPVITIAPSSDSSDSTLAAPNGIAFDNLGDLAAISSATPFGTALYGANQLAKSGGLQPSALLVGNTTTLNAPAGCNFGPVVQ
jgi:hypothetical protein